MVEGISAVGNENFAILAPHPSFLPPVAVMVEIEVSSQKEMANPQGMNVFAVKRHGCPVDFVSFSSVCGMQSSPLVYVQNRPIV